MHKGITLSNYVKSMVIALARYCYNDSTKRITEGVIECQALLFFEIFGKEISKNLVDFSKDKSLTGEEREEYYRALFFLYREMTNYDADLFIKCLNAYVERK